MTTVASPLKISLAGLGLWIAGFALGGLGNTDARFLWVTIPGDVLTTLGTVLAVAGAVSAGSSIAETVLVGALFGIGIFYVGEPHATHIASGIGFGLEHITHIFIGLGLWAAATGIAVVLAFVHSRAPRGSESRV